MASVNDLTVPAATFSPGAPIQRPITIRRVNSLSALKGASDTPLRTTRCLSISDDSRETLRKLRRSTSGLKAYRAIDPPPGYPKLNHLPNMLQSNVTIMAAVFYAALAAATLSLSIVPKASVPYAVHSDSYYFLVQYGPGVIASLSIFLYKAVSQELLHMLPYINMADKHGRKHAQYNIMSGYWPLLNKPNSPVTYLHWILLPTGTILIGYKAILLEIVTSGTSWQVYIHPAIARPLAAYYILMVLYMTWTTVWLWSRTTGIRPNWVPQNLADIISVFNCFNYLPKHASLAGNKLTLPVIPSDLAWSRYRLGYWAKLGWNDKQIIYGIRRLADGSNSISLDNMQADTCLDRSERKVAKRANQDPYLPFLFNMAGPFWYWIYSAIIVAGFALFVTVASTGYLQHGFAFSSNFTIDRLDHVASNVTAQATSGNINLEYHGMSVYVSATSTDSNGRRTGHLLIANFLLRTLPLVIMGQVAFGFAGLDPVYRYMQPLYNMTKKPCTAEKSISMDYLSRSAFDVVADAFKHRYWKVFLYCLLGSAPEFLMLLPYGVLTLVSVGDWVVGEFSIPAFCATCVLYSIYAMVLLGTWLTMVGRLPRPGMRLMDVWIMFQGGQIVQDAGYRICDPRWTKQHLEGRLLLQNDRYVLGVRQHTDGSRSYGFDVYSTGWERKLTRQVLKVALKQSWWLGKTAYEVQEPEPEAAEV